MKVPGTPRTQPRGHRERLVWLLACVFTGLGVAIIGNLLSESPAWYVAVPAAIAVGWLFLADPTECERPHDKRSKRASDSETAH